MNREQVEALLIAWIHTNTRNRDHVSISRDTELLESGLLDSFGLLELIAYVEDTTGLQIDLANADASEFVLVRGLCDLALQSQAARPCR